MRDGIRSRIRIILPTFAAAQIESNTKQKRAAPSARPRDGPAPGRACSSSARHDYPNSDGSAQITGEVVGGGNRLGRPARLPDGPTLPLKADRCRRVTALYAARVTDRRHGMARERSSIVGRSPTVGSGPDRVLEAHCARVRRRPVRTAPIRSRPAGVCCASERRFGSDRRAVRARSKPTRSGRANASAGTQTSEGGRATKHSLNFRNMFINQDLPYKVADISLAGLGPQGDRDRRARDARPDGRAPKVQRAETAPGGPDHGLAAHDDPDRPC